MFLHTLGRLLSVKDTKYAGQIQFKRLVRSNASDWSAALQTGGQMECNSPSKAISDDDAHLLKEGLDKLQNFFVAAGVSPW